MKIILVAALISFPFLALADTNSTSQPSATPGANDSQPAQELQAMTEKLKLTPAQREQIAPVLATEAKNRKAVEENPALSPVVKSVEIARVHQAALQQIKPVLTPKQVTLVDPVLNHPGAGPTHP